MGFNILSGVGRLIGGGVFALASFVAGPALAECAPDAEFRALPEETLERRLSVLERADADHDGRVSEAELGDALLKGFSVLDRSGDGFIGDEDAPRWFRGRFEAVFSRLLADQDGDCDSRLNFEEFAARPRANFSAADTDEDAVVELDALIDYVRTLPNAEVEVGDPD